MCEVGLLMIKGEKVQENKSEGAHLVIEAARLGCLKAKKEAANIFLKAGQLGHIQSYQEYAKMLFEGDGLFDACTYCYDQ